MARLDPEEYNGQLHQRLIQGDPLAPSDLTEMYLEEVVRRLRLRAGTVTDETLLLDAATDALLTYAQQPTKFDPSKSSLLNYLTMSALGDLRNMLARDRRRKRREVPLEDVEHSLSDENSLVEEIDDALLERYGVTTPEDKAALQRKIEEEFPSIRDRQLLFLMLHGERRTVAYSALLGIQDRDPKEQRRTVKRHKDRLTKRLQRLRGKLNEQKQGC